MKKLLLGSVMIAVLLMPVFGQVDLPAFPEEPKTTSDNVFIRKYLPDPTPQYNNERVLRAEGEIYALEPEQAIEETSKKLPRPVIAVSGVKGQKLSEKEIVDIVVDVSVNADGDYFIRDIREGFDATSWIENLPAGLRARVHRIKASDKTSVIKFYITGTPSEARRAPIRLRIPVGYLKSQQDAGADAQERIIGSSETELTHEDVIYTIPGDYFVKNVPEGKDITDWFENVPSDLKIIAHRVLAKDSNNVLRFYAPDHSRAELIAALGGTALSMKIPAAYLHSTSPAPKPERDVIYPVEGHYFVQNIEEGTDITSWFENAPVGYKIVAHELVAIDDEETVLKVNELKFYAPGHSRAELVGAFSRVKLHIPSDYLAEAAVPQDISVDLDSQYSYDDDYFVDNLPDGEAFAKELAEGFDITEWIENLPEGLSAFAYKVMVGDKELRFYVPDVELEDLPATIRVKIPPEYLKSQQPPAPKSFTVPIRK